MNIKITNSILLISLIILSFYGCKEEQRETKIDPVTSTDRVTENEKTVDLIIESAD